jgi:hypothetical protein
MTLERRREGRMMYSVLYVLYKLLIIAEKFIMLSKCYFSIGRNITEHIRTVSHVRHHQKMIGILSDIE